MCFLLPGNLFLHFFSIFMLPFFFKCLEKTPFFFFQGKNSKAINLNTEDAENGFLLQEKKKPHPCLIQLAAAY